MITQGDSMGDVNIHNFINDLRELLISTEQSDIEDIECYQNKNMNRIFIIFKF